MASKVFVGNLNFRTTKEEIEELFSQVGEIEEVFVPQDRDTGRPRGFAFVTYANDDAAKEAIGRFNGHELGGRPLRVNQAEERQRRSPGGPGRGRPGVSYEDAGFGGDVGDYRDRGGRGKGSRRNIRAKKRGL